MSLLSRAAAALDRRYGWDRLPKPIAILTLVGLRTRLRAENLYDTDTVHPVAEPEGEMPPRYAHARSIDGAWNDISSPRMGAVGARFGRNVPLARTFPEAEPAILEPNPRVVSRELLTRKEFIPATTLNLLAGAWLQFEVHDWFSHGHAPDSPWQVPLAPDDPWGGSTMSIPRTQRDPTSDDDPSTPPTFVTQDSHWWDASQIYGSSQTFADAVRSGENGKLRLDEHGLIPQDLEAHVDLSGVAGNFWVGLGLLHTLFMHEHNAICDAIHAAEPSWSDQEIYDRARLVNAALMAKIHTVEWTPALIAHPTTKLAMNANWWGLVGERFTKRFGRLGGSEVLSGIPGSPTNHNGVPYSLTEEFVAVYRMHPLLPDDFTFRSVGDGSVLQERTFPELGALHTRARLEEVGVANAFYSFGVSHPGAITLHNYPRFLQRLERPDGTVLDLAATDIMRDPRARRPPLQRLPRAVPPRPRRARSRSSPARRRRRPSWSGSTATSTGST